MPYKSEQIKIQGTKFDRRVKLTEQQKKEIHANKLGLSQRKLAAMYGVSRRLITFILDPEKLEHAKKLYKERRKDGRYYDKDKHTVSIREHRKHKQELFIKGEIKTNTDEQK